MNCRRAVLSVLLLLCSGCWPVSGGTRGENPNFPAQSLLMQEFQGLLWVQTSVEHQALCRQAFAAAAAQLDRAVADKGWLAALEQDPERAAALPPAVVVDVDETVLDNSPFQAALLKAGRAFESALFNQWVQAASARALPGALAFAKAAAARGVEVFYVTNRNAGQETATRRNLAGLGFPLDDQVDTLLMRHERPDWHWDKGSRRAAVAARYRIIMLVGDDFNDFYSGARTGVEQRRERSARFQDRWGVSWFMLPNPSYGSWLGAIYDFQWSITDEQKRLLRQQALDVFPLSVDGQ